MKRLNGYGMLDGLALPRTIERKKETGTRGTNSKQSGNDHRCDETALPEEWCPRRRAAREKTEAREGESMTLEMRIYKRRERRKRTGQRSNNIRKARWCDCPEHECA